MPEWLNGSARQGRTDLEEGRRCRMRIRIEFAAGLLIFILCGAVSSLSAQQKGQWLPGQFGLNAGVIPDSGITYANLAVNYSASQLNGPNGNSIPGVTGTYSFWVDENVIYYVPKHKILGGCFMPYVALNWANGELVANLSLNGNTLNGGGGGSGFADMYVQPLNIGWHFGPLHTRSFQQRRFRLLGKFYNHRNYALHHQEPGNNGEPGDRVGNPRAEKWHERHAGPSLHGRVGIGAGSAAEEGHEQAAPARLCWLRSMAGFAQRRNGKRRWHSDPSECNSVLLCARAWRSVQLHPSCEGFCGLLQILRRVPRSGSSPGPHHRVRFLVDLPNAETSRNTAVICANNRIVHR
jgi:hypothetical protein